MKIYRDWESITTKTPQAVTIGNFDGVHLGHQAILRRLSAIADERGERTLAVTFSNHTSEIVRHSWPPLLMDVDERLEALAANGIEEVLLLQFTEALAQTTASSFLERLVEIGTRRFVVGHDFRCGLGGQGDTHYVLDFAQEHGLSAEVVPAVRVDDDVVSSTRIRRLIADGKVSEAGQMLGRPFHIGGIVSHGEKRGRTLGFPTANLPLEPHRIIPHFGVYLVKAIIDGTHVYYGLGNVGVKPTFHEMPPLMEVFLFDFQGDIYGHRMDLDLLEFLRPERRFGSAEELVAQMNHDVDEGRRLIAMTKGVI